MTHLSRAKWIWRQDRPISTDLWFKLADLGYDVARLEAQYRS